MVHELAHQWFGDSVAPARWRDVWLNEGHANYYEEVYAEEFFGGLDYEALLAGRLPARRPAAGAVRPGRPSRRRDIFTLFSDNVYSGGSLVLYALRQVVGEDTFRAIERSWVRRYKDQSVSTEQFIAHERVSHRNLTVPARLAVRRDGAADARPPGLDRRPVQAGAAPTAPEAGKAPTAAALERLAKR